LKHETLTRKSKKNKTNSFEEKPRAYMSSLNDLIDKSETGLANNYDDDDDRFRRLDLLDTLLLSSEKKNESDVNFSIKAIKKATVPSN